MKSFKTNTLRTRGMLLLALVSILSGISCMENVSYRSPQGYDFNKPTKVNMPEDLTEISGIAFHRGNPDTIYAEQDEDGKVFYLRLGDKTVRSAKFAKSGDYEDIAILGDQVVILRSDGVLFVFPLYEVHSNEVQHVQKWNDVLPEGEYEGMFADEATSQLYVLCKHCADDNTKKSGSGYIFKLAADGSVTKSGEFSINVKDIEALAGKKKLAFHPSALAKNPSTKEWYILSSVNKALIIADESWKVKAVYPLNAALFTQPEGLTFDNQNNLYISNEGDKISSGNVLKFNYQK